MEVARPLLYTQRQCKTLLMREIERLTDVAMLSPSWLVRRSSIFDFFVLCAIHFILFRVRPFFSFRFEFIPF